MKIKPILFSILTTSLTVFLSFSLLSAQTPQINTSVNNLYSFKKLYIETRSDVQFYEVEASSLTSDLTIVAESPFKISFDCYDYFESEIAIPHDNGSVNQRIFVRAFPETTGQFNKAIKHSAQNATDINVGVYVESIHSQIPTNYYSTATTGGSTLKTELFNIINNHNVQTYNSLWQHFVNTDATFSGKVLDIYSDTPCNEPPYIYTFGDDQDTGSGGNSEGDVYNREHSMPRSWFGGEVSPMHTDIYHIYPVDKWVNAVRANYPYAVIESPTWTSMNGSKLGFISVDGYSGSGFEPIDEYKGDLARTYLYMITRYENQIENWTYSTEAMSMLDNKKYPGYKPWVIDMLLEWHESDPVSQKERLRNDAVYSIQGNRNPFVDFPEFVNRVWGDTTDLVNINSTLLNFHNDLNLYPNPTNGIIYYKSKSKAETIKVFNVNGEKVHSSNPENSEGKISLSVLPAGVYNVSFIYKEMIITRKIILL
jgi:endonuclease I